MGERFQYSLVSLSLQTRPSSGQGTTVSSSTQTRWEPVIRAAEMKLVLKGKVVVIGTTKPMILEQLTAPFDPRWMSLYGNPPTQLRDEQDSYFDPPSEPWNPWLTWKLGSLTEEDFTRKPEEKPAAKAGDLVKRRFSQFGSHASCNQEDACGLEQ